MYVAPVRRDNINSHSSFNPCIISLFRPPILCFKIALCAKQLARVCNTQGVIFKCNVSCGCFGFRRPFSIRFSAPFTICFSIFCSNSVPKMLKFESCIQSAEFQVHRNI